MAHRKSLYRVCGPALIAAGFLLLIAFAIKPAQPATLEAAAELGLAKWVLVNWIFVIGAVLLLGGWIGLTEHLNDAIVEGWSTLGLGGVVIGCVGLAIAGAINAEALPKLLDTYTDASRSLAVEGFFAVNAITTSLGMMAWTILWVGTALTGLAIAEDEEYPRTLGYLGLFIAALELSAELMPDDSLLHDGFGIIGCTWIIAVGFIFSRIDTANTARPVAEESVAV